MRAHGEKRARERTASLRRRRCDVIHASWVRDPCYQCSIQNVQSWIPWFLSYRAYLNEQARPMLWPAKQRYGRRSTPGYSRSDYCVIFSHPTPHTIFLCKPGFACARSLTERVATDPTFVGGVRSFLLPSEARFRFRKWGDAFTAISEGPTHQKLVPSFPGRKLHAHETDKEEKKSKSKKKGAPGPSSADAAPLSSSCLSCKLYVHTGSSKRGACSHADRLMRCRIRPNVVSNF